MELARSRRGKQIIFIPVPCRRNKKTIIARHWLFHPSFLAIRRRMSYQLATDLLATLTVARSSLALKKKRQLIDSLHEHRTEMERRWR